MKKTFLFLALAAFLLMSSCKKEEAPKPHVTKFSFYSENKSIAIMMQEAQLTNFLSDQDTKSMWEDSTYLTSQNSHEGPFVGVLIPITAFKTDDYRSEIQSMGYQIPKLNQFLSFISQERGLASKMGLQYNKIAVTYCGNTDLKNVVALMKRNYNFRWETSGDITFNECTWDELEKSSSRKIYLREKEETKIRRDLENNYNFVCAIEITEDNTISTKK